MEAIARVIEQLPSSRHSVNMRLCVRAEKGADGTCTRHVLTAVDPSQFPNTDPAWPKDYDSVIVRWVSDRLNDEPVPLDAKLPRAGRLAVSHGRSVVAECKAGGYERRTCHIELTTRRHGKPVRIGEGEKAIRYEADGREVKVKLNRRGRKLLREAPNRGLDAKARAAVSERYTDRSGTYVRSVRLKR